MGIKKVHLKDGMRFLNNKLTKKKHHRYQGSPRDISIRIVRDNWNGIFFQSGQLNHIDLTIRDVGLCAESLVFMGLRQELTKTLEYALHIFQKYNKITTTITREHKPIDVFDFSVDTLPFLIRSIRISGAGHLFSKNLDFLNRQLQIYYDTVFDEKKQIIFEKKNFSSIKSHHQRKSSMYDNCCAAMLSTELEILRKEYGLKIDNPFFKWNHKKMIRDRFWVGTHFLDDISNQHYVATDANIFPFYFGLFTDKDMRHSAINMIIGQALDSPIPAKYHAKRINEKENPLLSLVSGGYHGNACITKLGVIFLYVISKYDRIMVRKYLDVFLETIEEHNNFLEIFDTSGKPFVTPFYRYDEGMLWVSIFYQILEEFYKPIKKR